MRCLRYSALHGIEEGFTHDIVKELFKSHSQLLTLEDINQLGVILKLIYTDK